MLLDGGFTIELLEKAKRNPLFFRLILLEYQRKIDTEVARWNYAKLTRLNIDAVNDQAFKSKYHAIESHMYEAIEHGIRGLDYEPTESKKTIDNATALARWEENYGKLRDPATMRKIDQVVAMLQARRKAAKAKK